VLTSKCYKKQRRADAVKGAIVCLVLSTAALLAACGGGSNGESVASCDSISDIQSYRYTINLQLRSPAFSASGPTNTPAPLTAFADALQALFSDLKLDGAYKAPDRVQSVLKFQGGELELREIGDESWIRTGAIWQAQEPAEETNALTPEVVCRDIVDELSSALDDVDSTRESINGIDTDRYDLSEADLKQLPELLGAGAEGTLPEKYAVEVWLAREGRFPVRLNVVAEDVDEAGQPMGLTLFMEFRDINDAGINVEPPVVSQTGG
jgi:hypothetical protein